MPERTCVDRIYGRGRPHRLSGVTQKQTIVITDASSGGSSHRASIDQRRGRGHGNLMATPAGFAVAGHHLSRESALEISSTRRDEPHALQHGRQRRGHQAVTAISSRCRAAASRPRKRGHRFCKRVTRRDCGFRSAMPSLAGRAARLACRCVTRSARSGRRPHGRPAGRGGSAGVPTQGGPPPRTRFVHGVTLPSDVGAGTGPLRRERHNGAIGPSLGTPGNLTRPATCPSPASGDCLRASILRLSACEKSRRGSGSWSLRRLQDAGDRTRAFISTRASDRSHTTSCSFG